MNFLKQCFDTYEGEATYNEFKFVVQSFFTLLSREIIENGKVFIIPGRLGTIGALKRKLHINFIDWQKTRELGYLVKKMNNHSQNLIVKFKWDYKRDPFITIPIVWKFTASRFNKRYLAKEIFKNNTNKYFADDN